MGVLGLLTAGLLLGACAGEEASGTGAGGDAGSADAGTSPAAVADAGTASSSGDGRVERGGAEEAKAGTSGFRGGTERLDTGVDLSNVKLQDGLSDVQQPAYDPVVDADAPPGHIALAEGSSQEHDFGPMRQGDVGDHTFRLRSDGDAPLVITRLKPSCGCTVAEVALIGQEGERQVYRTGEEIPPGTEFEILAQLDTAGKSGPQSTSLAIYSNDPRAVFNLNLKADVRPVLMVTPAPTIQLGELSTVDTATGEVQVSSDSLDPFLLTLDERFLQGQPVEVDLQPVDPDAEGRSRTWDVRVTIGPDFPRPGLSNFPVVLKTDQEVQSPAAPNPDGSPVYHEVRVFAQAMVLQMVSPDSPFLSFGMLAPGSPKETSVRITTLDQDFTLPTQPTVRLEGFRGSPFEYAEHFDVEVVPVEGENALDVHMDLKGMPEGFSGSFGGLLVVEVGHPNQPTVEVRFSGVCRAGVTAPAAPPAQQPAAGGDDHAGHDH